jgi:hypothetical protein
MQKLRPRPSLGRNGPVGVAAGAPSRKSLTFRSSPLDVIHCDGNFEAVTATMLKRRGWMRVSSVPNVMMELALAVTLMIEGRRGCKELPRVPS